jgi:outer membrane protein assembly factor BamB
MGGETAGASPAGKGFVLSRGDAAQTGYTDFAPVLKPKVRWTRQLPAGLSHQTIQPVLTGDRKRLFLSVGGILMQLDADTGEKTWAMHINALSYPAIAGNTLYISGQKNLRAYDISGATPREKWVFSTTKPFNSDSKYCSSNGGLVTPLQDLVLVGCGMTGPGGVGDTALHAVKAADGQEAWAFDLRQRISPSIAADEAAGLAFMATMGSLVSREGKMQGQTDGFLCAVELGTGKEKWRVELGNGGMANGPACGGGVVYAGGNKELVAVNAADGKELWRVKRKTPSTYGAFRTHLVLTPERIVMQVGGMVEAYARQDGAQLWSQKTGQTYCLLATRDVLFLPIYAANGALLALSLSDGKTLWSHAAGDEKSQCKGVAIDEGRIYFGNYSGKLYCLENGGEL